MAEAASSAAPRRVYFKTFGCQMNEVDTGKMRALLTRDGWETVESPEDAELVVVNTCSVREKAVDKMHSVLGEYRQLKRRGQALTIGIAGCVPQERGEELARRYPDVDLVFGPDAVGRVTQLVDSARAGRRVVATDFLDLEEYPFVEHLDPAEQGVGAFVTIQKGCDNKCTFCIVPATRGVEVSRPVDAILDEVRGLVARGVQEITLIGQNVNSYGLKLTGGATFAQLLYRVAEVPGVLRIRYTTSHPRDMGPDVVAAYRDLPQLTSHLHLPVQSGSNKILRRMKRYYTREHYLRLVEALRGARPDLALTTDFIVGFPDEEEQDFEDTMKLLDEVGFVGSFSFKYNPRPGTPALKIRNQVEEEVAGERLTRLQARQRELSLAFHRGLEGQEVELLIEGPSRHDEGVICGRTSSNVMVNVPGEERWVGHLRRARVTRGFTNSCRGELLP